VDFAPAVDIEEKEDHFLVSADLPGVSEKDIEVRVHDGVLLSGKREVEGGEGRSRVLQGVQLRQLLPHVHPR
jgi:HSP20 family molecular chaperone IbpA